LKLTKAWLKDREEAAIKSNPKIRLDQIAAYDRIHIALNDPPSVLAMISAIKKMKACLETYTHFEDGLRRDLTAKQCLEEIFEEGEKVDEDRKTRT